MEGLFRRPGSPNPTLVNNVETLANVPLILERGPEWFRSFGTEDSPGTMLLTLSGDVRSPGVYELPLGYSLRDLVEGVGGGVPEGRALKAVFPGASNTIIAPEQLDTPLGFDTMGAVGTGLGSGGFVVYDDSACIVRATLAFSRFLYVESCGQCPACKHGTGSITDLLERIDRGEGSEADVETILARALTVTDAQRCALPTGETLIAQSAIQVFGSEFAEHFGRPCPRPRDLPVPKIVDFDEEGRRVPLRRAVPPQAARLDLRGRDDGVVGPRFADPGQRRAVFPADLDCSARPAGIESPLARAVRSGRRSAWVG